MDCQCVIPDGGWCERHQMSKSAHWVRLCQTHKDYWQAWESGGGPGQSQGSPARPLLRSQPGTELRRILGCQCGCSYTKRMNEWGPDVCYERIDRIVGWMVENGRKHQTPISEEAAKRIIVLAVERAKHAANTH